MKIDFDFSDPTSLLNLCKKRLAGFSVTRLAIFVLMVVVVIVGVSDSSPVALLFFPLCFLFIFLIKKFNEEKDKQQFLEAILAMKEDNILRKNRELTSFEEGGEFLDKNHSFASDLDLFGPHSLFQLINHTVSVDAKKLLANWLMSSTDVALSDKRRAAVRELVGKGQLLEKFEGIGKAFLKEEKSKTSFYSWLPTPDAWRNWYWVPALMGPVLGLILLSGVLFGWIRFEFLSIFILVGVFFLSFVFKPLLAAMKAMPNEGDLKTYRSWAMVMESQSFEDHYLKALHKPLVDTGFEASIALKALESQTFLIQNRANLMYLIFNLLFWIDFLALFRIEQWRKKYGRKMQVWESTFDEWEVLVSLASFEREENVSCDFRWHADLTIKVENLRHPLIHPQTCVSNDFQLGKNLKLGLLTGSNMSGKTTFMRTLGINHVMANIGLSPMATKYHSGPFLLYTSMRNTDNLGESVSSFYAELSRIKGLLALTESGTPVFFLLDEILKGTNTSDRIMGSEALIRQLLATPAKGIISTHDIELSDLAASIPELSNFSFHHDIRDNEISFDYKIKSGPCPNFNAHKLMELMGIRF
ncbi:MutS-related protein [Lunatibacter salilacus]|uniref:MutS-related protein n=1 Tax=Lunatibacter salilacus TaxID=2483804 RepID=UPI00131CB848|nr:DNA mismatch repair protein [Lunatibacter salilacus]